MIDLCLIFWSYSTILFYYFCLCFSGLCGVIEQKDEGGQQPDSACGAQTQQGYAGLCEYDGFNQSNLPLSPTNATYWIKSLSYYNFCNVIQHLYATVLGENIYILTSRNCKCSLPTEVAYKQQFYLMFYTDEVISLLISNTRNKVAQTRWNFNQLQRGS